MKRSSLISKILILFLVALIWGFGFVAQQVAADSNFSSFVVVCFRGLLGSLCCLPFIFKEKPWKDLKFVFGSLFAGFVTFLGYLCSFYGQMLTSVSSAAFFVSFEIVFVPFLSFVFYKTKLLPKSIIGAIIGIIGLFVFTYKPGEIEIFSVGNLVNLATAFFFAIQICQVSKLSTENKPFSLAFGQSIVVFILGLLFIPFTGGFGNFSGSFIGIGAIAYLGIFATFITLMLQNYGQKNIDPAIVSVILSTETVFGTFFGIIIYKDALTIQTVVGIVILFIAILICTLDLKKIFKSKKKENIER